ncbi:MAG: DUF6029 family protein [bacterium]
MKNLLFLLIFAGYFLLNTSAQEKYILPSGLYISNQLKYSFDIENKTEIFENWLNLNYRYNVFSAGIRFESFQPNDPNPNVNRNKKVTSDIAFKYISVDLGDKNQGLSFSAGNYYVMFGRGMVLKSYENRDLRIDNNLMGLMIKGNYDDLFITTLSGSAENLDQKREDVLHAVDLEYKLTDFLKLGVSYAVNLPKYENIARTEMISARLQPSIWNFDLYTEFGVKKNNDLKKNNFENNEAIAGKGLYSGINFYYQNFSISSEYKYYDNFKFSSSDNSIIYNTPPSVRKDYTYILLNRHPSTLDQNNESGFQVDANYAPLEDVEINLCYSKTKSLPKGSYFQRANKTNIPAGLNYEEYYSQLFYKWNDLISSTFAFCYTLESSSNTKNFTPVFENEIYLDETNSIKVIFEHQFTKDQTTFEKYYSDLIMIEYFRSPKFSVSTVVEMKTSEPKSNYKVRKLWGFIQLGYKIGEHTDISLLAGSKQAGNICIGGVCRYEPEFRGVQLRMMTNLY